MVNCEKTQVGKNGERMSKRKVEEFCFFDNKKTPSKQNSQFSKKFSSYLKITKHWT